jgi:hypothetical protein
MDRIALALALVAVAVAVAVVLQRRRPEAPTRPSFAVPEQVDRSDFGRADAPWLVAVFTSETCDSCRAVWDKARLLDSSEVAVQEVEAVRDRDLHQRYGIDAVPLVVIADDRGVVGAHFLGPVTATDLWAAMAELREPGTVPPHEGCDRALGD